MATLRYRARLLTLLVMGGFGVMGGGLLAPALPTLIGPFGVSAGAVGLVLSVYTLAAALTLPFTGLLLDLLGRRPVALGCLLIDGSFGLLCMWAPNFSTLLLLRFLQGVGIAGLIPVAMTIVSDWYSGEHRLRIMGYLSGTIAVAAVVIPLLGGLLGELDWRYPFAVYGFSLLLAAAFFVIVPESGSPTPFSEMRASTGAYIRSLRATLKLAEVREVFLHSLVLHYLLYALVTFLPLFLASEHGLRVGIAGAALAFHGLVAALVSTRAVGVQHLLGRRGALLLGYLCIGLSLSTVVMWPQLYGVALSLAFFGAGMGITQPAVFHWVSGAGPPELTGAIVALFNTVKFVGMTLAPPTLRWVFDYAGVSWAFYVAAGIAVLWALRAATYRYSSTNSSAGL